MAINWLKQLFGVSRRSRHREADAQLIHALAECGAADPQEFGGLLELAMRLVEGFDDEQFIHGVDDALADLAMLAGVRKRLGDQLLDLAIGRSGGYCSRAVCVDTLGARKADMLRRR